MLLRNGDGNTGDARHAHLLKEGLMTQLGVRSGERIADNLQRTGAFSLNQSPGCQLSAQKMVCPKACCRGAHEHVHRNHRYVRLVVSVEESKSFSWRFHHAGKPVKRIFPRLEPFWKLSSFQNDKGSAISPCHQTPICIRINKDPAREPALGCDPTGRARLET